MDITSPFTIKKADNPIASRYWNQVLYLLGTALFIDGEPSLVKIDTLLDVVIELKFVIDPTVKIRRQTLRVWYELHKEELSGIDISLDDNFLRPMLQEISLYGHKVDILTGLVRIVIADGDYSYPAQALTRKTVLLWYIPANHYDDINYICADLIKTPAPDLGPSSLGGELGSDTKLLA